MSTLPIDDIRMIKVRALQVIIIVAFHLIYLKTIQENIRLAHQVAKERTELAHKNSKDRYDVKAKPPSFKIG